VIFLLPFGTLLLPAMAEVLDRRRISRRGYEGENVRG